MLAALWMVSEASATVDLIVFISTQLILTCFDGHISFYILAEVFWWRTGDSSLFRSPSLPLSLSLAHSLSFFGSVLSQSNVKTIARCVIVRGFGLQSLISDFPSTRLGALYSTRCCTRPCPLFYAWSSNREVRRKPKNGVCTGFFKINDTWKLLRCRILTLLTNCGIKNDLDNGHQHYFTHFQYCSSCDLKCYCI